MQLRLKHDWPSNPREAEQLQSEMSRLVVRQDQFPPQIHTVAGVDVSYDKSSDSLHAAAVVLDAESLTQVDAATVTDVARFPYIPGLFSFRELPPLCAALQHLRVDPDLIICDGQGIAHPRRFGLASHLGVLFDVPTIGCGKSCLTGEYVPPPPNRGDFSDLVDAGGIIGSVLRTQSNVKPIFVSIGHCVSLPTARNWILRLAPRFRQPEPIRRANELANWLRRREGPGDQHEAVE